MIPCRPIIQKSLLIPEKRPGAARVLTTSGATRIQKSMDKEILIRWTSGNPCSPHSAIIRNRNARATIEKCQELAVRHGHLNNVAWWGAHVASRLFPEDPDRQAVRHWRCTVGIWLGSGEFVPERQLYLERARGDSLARINRPESLCLQKNVDL